MHELSIVLGIVDIASEEVKKANARKVEEINLEVGSLSGIEMEALDFALECGTRHTVLEGSEISIDKIEAKSRCHQCGNVFWVKDYFDPCPVCHEWANELIQGKELRIKSLVVS